MGFEDRRKQLIATGPSWDDPRPHHVPETLQCHCVELTTTSDSSTLEALTIRDMNTVVESPPVNNLGHRISTRGWSLEEILKTGNRFRRIQRLPLSSSNLTANINKSEQEGQPLIIEGLHKHPQWRRDAFHPEWLMANGPKDISVRNVHDWSDGTIPCAEFIAKSRASPQFASPDEQERLYGKDAECPEEWNKWLQNSKVIPPFLTPHHVDNLLSSHVETLMCYLGIGDTFTPCHKDLCASSGQNLMCYTEHGGSSFWFMTRSSDAPEASKYFQNLKQELDHETHVITIEQLARAPFDVFVEEQQLGDLVLVPPRSCHQVVNYGGITIKTSWSRMTLKGLETAYYHELPIYRRVCRAEIYRVKFTIYDALRQSTGVLTALRRRTIRSRSTNDVVAKTKTLLQLFDDILLEEYSPTSAELHCLSSRSSSEVASSGFSDTSSDHADGRDGHITCDFCGADIFQSFFECLKCVATNASRSRAVEHGDGFVVCAGCYVEGRSCKCAVMDPIQCRPFKELLSCRNKAVELLSANKRTDNTFPPLALDSRKGTFRTACLLQQIRKKKRDTKVCTLPQGDHSSHKVPYYWALTCKKCHSAKCFMHLLMLQRLHATDALLIHFLDSSHQEHHNHHLSSRKRFEDGIDTFLQSQKEATKPDLSLQRAHLALQYGTCKPINSQFMSLGWYDTHAHMLYSACDQGKELIEDGTPMAKLPPITPILTERKRKREFMVCIEIPAASHKTKRPSRSTSNTVDTVPFNALQENITSIQLVSNEAASSSSTEVTNTQQTNSNGPTVTAENAIMTQDPSSSTPHDVTATTKPNVKSPALSNTTAPTITTSTATSGEPANSKRRRKSRFSPAMPSPDPSAPNALKTGVTATTDLMSNVPTSETVSSTSQRQKNPMLEAPLNASSRSCGPALEGSWNQGSAGRKTDILEGLRFKKQPFRNERPPHTPVPHQSSSSSAYLRSTSFSPDNSSHGCNRPRAESHAAAHGGDPSTASNNNNYPLPSTIPIASGFNNDLGQVLDGLSKLTDEVNSLRQNQEARTSPSSLEQQQSVLLGLLQLTSDIIIRLAAVIQMVNATGTTFSIPPHSPSWSQESQVPLSYAEQQRFYRMPATTRHEHEYQRTWPAREYSEQLGRGRYHEVPHPDAAFNAGFSSKPESYVNYPGPRREWGHDDLPIHPMSYGRRMYADAGKYEPRQRSPHGVTRGRYPSTRQPANDKYYHPYNRSRANNGWRRSHDGRPNAHVYQRRIPSERAPSCFAVNLVSDDRRTEQNRDHLCRNSPQRHQQQQGPLQMPPPPIGHRSNESFSSSHLTAQTLSQPILPHQEYPVRSAVGMNIPPQTPFTAHAAPSGDGANDEPLRPQTPLVASSAQSQNWEDNYAQEETMVAENADTNEHNYEQEEHMVVENADSNNSSWPRSTPSPTYSLFPTSSDDINPWN